MTFDLSQITAKRYVYTLYVHDTLWNGIDCTDASPDRATTTDISHDSHMTSLLDLLTWFNTISLGEQSSKLAKCC